MISFEDELRQKESEFAELQRGVKKTIKFIDNELIKIDGYIQSYHMPELFRVIKYLKHIKKILEDK